MEMVPASQSLPDQFNKSAGTLLPDTEHQTTKGSQQNNARISPALHPKRLCWKGIPRGMLTFASEAPRVPSCHCLSVITESLIRLPIPASHNMSQPKKCILCCGSAPETTAPGQEPGESRVERLPQTPSHLLKQKCFG